MKWGEGGLPFALNKATDLKELCHREIYQDSNSGNRHQ